MAETSEGLDLHSDGVRDLVRLTNSQFAYWQSALMRETTEEIPAGNVMDYWFIMSELVLHEPEFQIKKKDAFASIPNLKPDTIRRHVAAAERLGFVQTVKTKGMVHLQLTAAGQRAIADTLKRWVQEFGKIQKRHFGA